MLEINKDRRGHDFIPAEAAEWAGIGTTEDVPMGDKLIIAHYFVGGADWWLTEINTETGEAFGYVSLIAGSEEWGYIYLPELEAVLLQNMFPIERDCHWEQKTAREVLPKEAWDWE